MSANTQKPAGFTIGDALSLTFRELTRRLGHYLPLMLLLSLPGLIVSLTSPIDPNFGASEPTPEQMAAFWSAFAVQAVVGLFAYGVIIGAFTYSVVSGLRGQDLSLGACLSSAVGRLHYVLPTLLIVGVIIMLGSILLVVPGIIAALIFYVAASVAAAEGAWPGKALSRSQFLTRGSRWSLLGLFLVQIAISLVLVAVLSVVALALLGAQPAELASNPEKLATYTIISMIVGLPFNAFFAMLPVTVYFLMSVEKDGRDLGDVEQVFN